jgi:Asp-tRNA(Asn)/Glu-tRNA(Gln) amidotransferase A subunit family amidase
MAHDKTNCLTEVFIQEAEGWLQDGSINLQGPLAGIPVSLKDSISVGGFDASVGYGVNTGKPAPADGSLVRLLKSAGAVPFVKTALPITLLSFESFNDVWGRCLNPHNPKYSPGGSTGGEGALLALGGSRIGIGSDVAGSMRAPAHFSGCYSLRCSTGRWPKQGVNTSMPGQEGIPSVFSPMSRTLHDLSYFTRSFMQLEPWKFDHSVHPIPWREETYTQYSTKKKPLRIGVLRTDNVVDPSPACARALNTCVSALRASGHEIIPIEPPSPYRALVIASNLLNADGTTTFRSYFPHRRNRRPRRRRFRLLHASPALREMAPLGLDEIHPTRQSLRRPARIMARPNPPPSSGLGWLAAKPTKPNGTIGGIRSRTQTRPKSSMAQVWMSFLRRRTLCRRLHMAP